MMPWGDGGDQFGNAFRRVGAVGGGGMGNPPYGGWGRPNPGPLPPYGQPQRGGQEGGPGPMQDPNGGIFSGGRGNPGPVPPYGQPQRDGGGLFPPMHGNRGPIPPGGPVRGIQAWPQNWGRGPMFEGGPGPMHDPNGTPPGWPGGPVYGGWGRPNPGPVPPSPFPRAPEGGPGPMQDQGGGFFPGGRGNPGPVPPPWDPSKYPMPMPGSILVGHGNTGPVPPGFGGFVRQQIMSGAQEPEIPKESPISPEMGAMPMMGAAPGWNWRS